MQFLYVRGKSLFARLIFVIVCSVQLMCLKCLYCVFMCIYLIKPQHMLFRRRWSVDAHVRLYIMDFYCQNPIVKFARY